jgi:NADH:ubiquinone oxidoreductase subunit H
VAQRLLALAELPERVGEVRLGGGGVLGVVVDVDRLLVRANVAVASSKRLIFV